MALQGPANAQEFPPARPVSLVVGFAAGGAADAAARMIAKKLAENIGQSVVVDNKPGAGGNIAHKMVANGPADGTVLLFGSIGPLTIAPHPQPGTRADLVEFIGTQDQDELSTEVGLRKASLLLARPQPTFAG